MPFILERVRRAAPVTAVLRLAAALALAATGLAGSPTGATAASLPAATGNLLVMLERGQAASAARSAVHTAVTRAGGRLAGRSVPEIGLVTVRPPAGVSPAAFARRLRHLRGVASVQPEHRYVPRVVPNDPALSTPDQYSQTVQWTLAREGFYDAWNISRGDGALVGVVDTGIDATHPDLAAKIAAAVDQQEPSDATGPAATDQVGHGTHVASLACAATGNGIGIAGAGYDCKLVIEKSDFTDSSIAAAIVDATNRHVGAINMSFGPATPTSAPAPPSEVSALDYAAAHKVVLVAAAADEPGNEQGDPANVVQPAGTGAEIDKGLGLDVTAAQLGGARAGFAGHGSEVSLAAYGALEPGQGGLPGLGPPPGILGAFPANVTSLESPPQPCLCRATFDGSSGYAYLQGTSMAAPQVAAVGAMMRALNPFASLREVLRTLKQTAQRPAGTGWTDNLGWGILDAGAALDAIRRVDNQAPVSRLRAPRVSRRATFRLRWSGHDARTTGLVPSGIAHYDLYVRAGHGHRRLLARTDRQSRLFHGRPGGTYTFTLVAVDRAGNRESDNDHARTRVAA